MFNKQIKLIKVIESYRGQEHVYGLNDCNILVADVIDAICETTYAEKLKGQYTNIIEGLKVAKQKVGFNNAREAILKHGTKVSYPMNGDICIKKQKHGSRVFYSASIYWNEQVLLELDNKYVWSTFNQNEFEEFYSIGE